jgi:hypothetical protein
MDSSVRLQEKSVLTSCAASPLKLLELESSKQIYYQVAASPLNRCALFLAEMITINKLSHKLNASLHRSKLPSSPLPMQHTSFQGDKSSSSDEQMKDNKCTPSPKMRPSSMKMLPLINGSYGSMKILSMQAQTTQEPLLKLSRVFLKPSWSAPSSSSRYVPLISSPKLTSEE